MNKERKTDAGSSFDMRAVYTRTSGRNEPEVVEMKPTLQHLLSPSGGYALVAASALVEPLVGILVLGRQADRGNVGCVSAQNKIKPILFSNQLMHRLTDHHRLYFLSLSFFRLLLSQIRYLLPGTMSPGIYATNIVGLLTGPCHLRRHVQLLGAKN